jgi:glucose dehydrogenase
MLMNHGDKNLVIGAQIVVLIGAAFVLPGFWGTAIGWGYLALLVFVELMVLGWLLWWRKRI